LLRVVFCAVIFSSSWSGVELRVMRPVCRMLVYCPQAIRSAIKTSVASSWHFISTYHRCSWATGEFGDFSLSKRIN